MTARPLETVFQALTPVLCLNMIEDLYRSIKLYMSVNVPLNTETFQTPSCIRQEKKYNHNLFNFFLDYTLHICEEVGTCQFKHY